MRKRNPDMEAYRDWQSDRSDRQALQRYLSSASRESATFDDPATILEIDEAIGEDDPLYPIYQRTRFDYTDPRSEMKRDRWLAIVKQAQGRGNDPRIAMILAFMGQRAGIEISEIYRILRDHNYVSDNIYNDVYRMISNDYYEVRSECAWALGQIGPSAASAIPALMNRLENDDDFNVRWICANALGKIGPAAASAVPTLIHRLENDDHWHVRYYCAVALGRIGPSAASAVPELIHRLENDDYYDVRRKCAEALGKIGPVAASAVPTLIHRLENDDHWNVRRNCAWALGKIGPSAASAVPSLIHRLENDDDGDVRDACRTAIEQITGEAPQ